jgi:hypothetical protein
MAEIIILPVVRRSTWDMTPSDCEPVDLAGILAGRPPRSKPVLVQTRRIISDDDMHGGGDAA